MKETKEKHSLHKQHQFLFFCFFFYAKHHLLFLSPTDLLHCEWAEVEALCALNTAWLQ